MVRFVRRALGVEAFGFNWYELPANVEGRRHDERESGQEEVNVVVRGSGVYRDRRRGGARARGDVPALRPRDGALPRRRALTD